MAAAKQLRLFMPHLWPVGNVSFTNIVLDGTGDSVGWQFEAANEEAITHVGFRIASSTGTITNLATVSLETPNSTGIPNGTDVGATLTTFTPSTASGWQWVALQNSYTPSPGEFLSFVVRGLAGLSAADNFLISRNDAAGNQTPPNRPYAASQQSGVWSAPVGGITVFGIRTANTRYGLPMIQSLTNRSTSVVGHRNAMYFTVGTDLGATYELLGIRGQISPAAAVNKLPLLGVWDTSGALLGTTKPIDSDQFLDASNSQRDTTFYFNNNPPLVLSCGTEYYAGLQTADAANGGVAIRVVQLAEEEDKLAFSGGTDVGAASWNGTAWTKDMTNFGRPIVELIVQNITPASSTGTGGPGGGGAVVKVHPGMAGGMRG